MSFSGYIWFGYSSQEREREREREREGREINGKG
jgi:hypothetical protein